jgi:SAM-dependent methyltransferase
MSSTARSLAKRLSPRAAIRQFRSAQTAFQAAWLPSTHSILQRASTTPEYLAPALLPPLQQRYPAVPEYGYGAADLERRGQLRAREILRLPGGSRASTTLELGCWDGMVSGELQRMGRQATAVDNRAEGFDPRATAAGARLLQQDATHLEFEDASFDCVFSYDAFEHVGAPDLVLLEAARVTKPGGHVFLEFGPIYFSPRGQHLYRSIRVPYCHVLFSPADLQEFSRQHGFEPIDFTHVNGWSLERYRGLWQQCSRQLFKIEYEEVRDLSHLDLIRHYPSCFKSKAALLDNFVVSSIRVVFQKLG